MRTACVLASGGLLGPKGLNQPILFPRQWVLLKRRWPAVPAGVIRELRPLASTPCSILFHFSLLGLGMDLYVGAWGLDYCTVCAKTSRLQSHKYPPASQLNSSCICWEPVICQSVSWWHRWLLLRPCLMLCLHLTREVNRLSRKFEGAQRLTVFHSFNSHPLPGPEILSPAGRVQFWNFLRLSCPS